MVKEGIVLGHKISKSGIEVDKAKVDKAKPWKAKLYGQGRHSPWCHKISKSGIEVDKAKVDVIAKLPHPTTVKGIRSFLGHAGFYRRFIQDFSKIARPMTRLLEKETPFIFSKECIEAFETLKMKLTQAPILVAPNWEQHRIGACVNFILRVSNASMHSFEKINGVSFSKRWVIGLAFWKNPE
ncbi:hypothetical protein Tco_0076460 [Tanacetum coccineum]